MNVDLTHGSIFRGLLRFSLPLMAGNLLQQLYNLVDTFVVGRYCGEIALAAVGSAFSVMILLTSIVTGLCMGSGVVVSQLFGQKDDAGVRKAVGNAFVLIAGVSALLTILSYALLPVMMTLLRIPPEAQGVLSCYLLIVFIGIIPTFLYNFGACMLRAVGNSTAPLVFLLISSLTNVALDFLFVAVLPWGVAGAAIATGISQIVGGVLPLVYFLRPNSSLLRLGKCRMDLRALLKTCSNGSSEFMSNVSMSLVSMLYNVQLMKYAGEDGVSAYGVLMYVNMIFQAIYIGYSVGTAPVVSFHYGAGNRGELRGLLRRSGGLLAVCAVCMLAAGQVLAAPLSRLYVGYDPGLFRMTSHAFSIFSFSFLFSGFAIYGSSFFTALNDGLTSAIIAFLRALVFQVGAVLLFPLLWRLDGIWMSIVAAEVMAVVATGIFLLAKRKRYGY